MINSKTKNIIFDLDGTLIDSSYDILKCIKWAYSSLPMYCNLLIDRQSIISGSPLEKIIYSLTPNVSKEDFKILHDEFRCCYDNNSFSETVLRDGIYGMLQYLLKNENIKMFIATNKPEFVTNKILKKLCIETYFTDVISLNTLKSKEMNKSEMLSYIINTWELDKSSTIMVGDNESDIIAAVNNGIKGIYIKNFSIVDYV